MSICTRSLFLVLFSNDDIFSHYLLILLAHRKGYSLQTCRRSQVSQHQHRREEGGAQAQPVSPSQSLPAGELRQ